MVVFIDTRTLSACQVSGVNSSFFLAPGLVVFRSAYVRKFQGQLWGNGLTAGAQAVQLWQLPSFVFIGASRRRFHARSHGERGGGEEADVAKVRQAVRRVRAVGGVALLGRPGLQAEGRGESKHGITGGDHLRG